MNLDKNQLEELRKICQSHKVKHIYLFGSALRDDFNENSDYDFLVRFQEMEVLDYLDNYEGLMEGIKTLLGRDVDLIEEKALKNPYILRSINANKTLVYG